MLVCDIMSDCVVYVIFIIMFDECMVLMMEKYFCYLLVFNEDGSFVGIILIGDLVKEIISMQ